MEQQDEQSLQNFFGEHQPTHEEVVQKLRTDGQFTRFAIKKYFAAHPEMLEETSGDGISLAEAKRRIEDGTA